MAAPAARDPEPRAQVIRRRLVTVPRSFAILLVLVLGSPLLAAIAALVDLVRFVVRRRPAMSLRLLAFALVFFFVEAIGLLKLAASWARRGFGASREGMEVDAWRIQVWWAESLFRAVQKIFRLEFDVEGAEIPEPGPVIALFRHASIVDNLLPAVLITARLGIRLRWVVKRELLTLPSLDVAGRRLPNYFVNRNSPDPRTELRQIRQLGENLGPQDGVLIFPEGTRFTPQRRKRALAYMESSGDSMLASAKQLTHLMPPRPGGTTTLLDSGADVVVGAHYGLEGFARITDLWAGGLVGRRIAVRLTRHDAATIPSGRKDRVDWLYAVWSEMDGWIDEGRARRSGA